MTELLKHEGFIGSVEVSMEDHCLHGQLLFIEDTVTYEAETPSGLEQAFKEAVEDYIQICQELGRAPQKPFSGSFNVRVGMEQHKQAVIQARLEGISLNELVKDAISKRLSKDRGRLTVHHVHEHKHEHKLMIEKEENLSISAGVNRWKVVQTSFQTRH